MSWILNSYKESRKENPFSFLSYFLIGGGFEEYKKWVTEITTANDSNIIWSINYDEKSGTLEYYYFDEEGKENHAIRNLIAELETKLKNETIIFQSKFRSNVLNSILYANDSEKQINQHLEFFKKGKSETKDLIKLKYFDYVSSFLQKELLFLKSDVKEIITIEQTMILPPIGAMESLLYDYEKIIELIGGIFNDPNLDLIINPVSKSLVKKVFNKTAPTSLEKIQWKKDHGKPGSQKLLRFINILIKTGLIYGFSSNHVRNKWLKANFASETGKDFDFGEAQKELNRTPNFEFESKLMQRIHSDFPWLTPKS
jgi:hypothetical protein